ncbi:unnamed protein product [Debaryomyces tyrocola]|nr:unnamed protein product [Debaryomyces tyrocola]
MDNYLYGSVWNKYRGVGDEDSLPHAYGPIMNSSYRYPHENGLNRITSLDQINHFHEKEANSYLDFMVCLLQVAF